MLQEVYDGASKGKIDELMFYLDANGDGSVDISEFVAASRKYPVILRPAYSLQRKMKDITLSNRGWEQVCKRDQKAYEAEKQRGVRTEERRKRDANPYALGVSALLPEASKRPLCDVFFIHFLF